MDVINRVNVACFSIDTHIEKKMNDQLTNIFNGAAASIQRKRKEIVKKTETKKAFFNERESNAAMKIKGAIYVRNLKLSR